MCMPPSRGPGRQPRSRRWGVRGGDPELVRTAVELANHQVEVAQLRQALASRVWIEQAKGMVAATEGITFDQAFHHLRGGCGRRRASWPRSPKSSSRTSSVSGSRPRRWTTPGPGGRGAGSGGRTGVAGGPDRAGPTHRSPDRTQDVLAARERAADQRDHIADERDRAADDRNHLADARERAADVRDRAADEPE